MGRIEIVYLLKSLREVLAESDSSNEDAAQVRQYTHDALTIIADALEELIEHKRTSVDLDSVLNQWVKQIEASPGTKPLELNNPQSIYAFDCAKACHTEAQLAENRLERIVLTNVGTVLVRLAEWLDNYPPC